MAEARSYDYPVQYEVRIRVNVNAKTPQEAVTEAQQLLASHSVFMEVIDPRGNQRLVGPVDVEWSKGPDPAPAALREAADALDNSETLQDEVDGHMADIHAATRELRLRADRLEAGS